MKKLRELFGKMFGFERARELGAIVDRRNEEMICMRDMNVELRERNALLELEVAHPPAETVQLEMMIELQQQDMITACLREKYIGRLVDKLEEFGYDVAHLEEKADG